MSLSDLGKVAPSLLVSNLEVQGHGSSSTSGSVIASGNIMGRVLPSTSVVTGSTVTSYPVTTSDVLSGIINHSALGSTLTLPDADDLVAAIPRCKVGTTIPLLLANTGGGTVTIAQGSGGTLVGAATTTATTVHTLYWIRITNITSGAQAYVTYRVSTGN